MIDCARVQAALSARLDGEDTGVPDDVVDAWSVKRFLNRLLG